MSSYSDSKTATTVQKLYVVIPAAGESRRMGQPKLLMKILGKPLIAWLVGSLDHPHITSVSILVRPNDAELLRLVEELNVQAVVPEAPTCDMKESVACLIEHLRTTAHPQSNDGWMLIPADHPIVHPEVLESVIDAWTEAPDHIVVPGDKAKRGHPVIFPWRLTECFWQIPPDQGLNWLLQRPDVSVLEMECKDPSIGWDVDTPGDFQRVRQFLEEQADL